MAFGTDLVSEIAILGLILGVSVLSFIASYDMLPSSEEEIKEPPIDN